MTLKYRNYLATISKQPCPCTNEFIPRDIEIVYRFMHTTVLEKHFDPPALQSPRKNIDCGHYALSFYRSLGEATKRYKELGKKINVAKLLGTKIGALSISTNDGIASDFDKHGHMDLHPYDNVTFATRNFTYPACPINNPPQIQGAAQNAP